jgi:hypothetical protein
LRVSLQDELQARAAQMTVLDDASTILRQTWRSAVFQPSPSVTIVHAGIAADVLLGLRMRLEEGDTTVTVPWIRNEVTSPYPALPADLRAFRKEMARADAMICVLPPSPEPWWTAWIAGALTAIAKPAALLNLPDGGPRSATEPPWWLRELPYLAFADSPLIRDLPWIHSSEAAYVGLHAWTRGSEPFVH